MLRLICFCLSYNVSFIAILIDLQCTVMPAKSDSDVMFCLQSYQILRIDRSFVGAQNRIITQVIYRFASAQVECTR